MTNPTITPKPKPQPDGPRYGFDSLELYTRLTRATYSALFGVPPPTWDGVRQIQRWSDSGAAILPADETYIDPLTGKLPFAYVVDQTNFTVSKKSIVMTNKQASTPNLPGATTYPKYSVAPAGLYIPTSSDVGVIQKSYVDPFSLSTFEQAQGLVLALQASGLSIENSMVETNFGGPFAFQSDPGEMRRLWNVKVVGGSTLNVGLLLASKNAAGVGAPGHWEKNTNPMYSDIRWISDVPTDVGEQDPRPEIPIPQRELYANEHVVSGGLMGQAVIERTDNAQAKALDDANQMATRVRLIWEKVQKFPF